MHGQVRTRPHVRIRFLVRGVGPSESRRGHNSRSYPRHRHGGRSRGAGRGRPTRLNAPGWGSRPARRPSRPFRHASLRHALLANTTPVPFATTARPLLLLKALRGAPAASRREGLTPRDVTLRDRDLSLLAPTVLPTERSRCAPVQCHTVPYENRMLLSKTNGAVMRTV